MISSNLYFVLTLKISPFCNVLWVIKLIVLLFLSLFPDIGNVKLFY